ALHKRLLRRWWRRLLDGQPGVALELHYTLPPLVSRPGGEDDRSAPDRLGQSAVGHGRAHARRPGAWLAVSCPQGLEKMVEAALRPAFPTSRGGRPGAPVPGPAVRRLKKHGGFIRRVKALDLFEHEREPPVNGLIPAMGACGEPAFMQIAMTPAPATFEQLAKYLYKRPEAPPSRERREHPPPAPPFRGGERRAGAG